MKNKYRKEKCTFRLLNLSKDILNKFMDEFQGFNLQPIIGQYFRNKTKYVISIPFSRRIPSQKIIKFIKRNKLSNYGLCFYLSTNKDMDGISVSKDIVAFYKKMGGTLDFSFIYIE